MRELALAAYAADPRGIFVLRVEERRESKETNSFQSQVAVMCGAGLVCKFDCVFPWHVNTTLKSATRVAPCL